MTMLAAGVLGWATLAGGTTAQLDGPRTIVVAQDGSGDVATVAAGVAMAHDGDTVLVRPGRYVERITVETDIELRGEGPREDVVIQAPDDPARRHDGTPVSVGLTYRGSFGSLAGLTVIGTPRGRAISIEEGAAPAINNVVIDAGPWTGENVAIWWSDGGSGVIHDSTVTGILGMENGGTAPVIEWNRLWQTCIVVRFDGGSHDDQPRPVIRDNAIAGCPTGVAVRVEAGSPVMEDNDVVLDGGTGLSLAGSGGTVRRNTFHDSGAGVVIANPRSAVIVTDNTVRGNAVGISVIDGGATIRIEGNTLTDNELALNLARQAGAAIGDNVLCGNALDVRVIPAGGPVPSLDGDAGCEALGPRAGA